MFRISDLTNPSWGSRTSSAYLLALAPDARTPRGVRRTLCFSRDKRHSPDDCKDLYVGVESVYIRVRLMFAKAWRGNGPMVNDDVPGHGKFPEGWIEPFHLVERADSPFRELPVR